MKLQEAVQRYVLRWQEADQMAGSRYESYLPGSKDEIKKAFKLLLAFFVENRSLTRTNAEHLRAVMALDSFVPDDKAKRINTRKQRIPGLYLINVWASYSSGDGRIHDASSKAKYRRFLISSTSLDAHKARVLAF